MHQPETILIVDDEDLLRELLMQTLEAFGYRVLEASSGREALRLSAQEAVDLVLLDINMPEMDGFAVCEALKADPASREIPVIFLSARLEPEEKLRAFHAGGVDYVSKPFESEELRVRIQTHVQIQRQRTELVASHALLEKALFDAGMMNKNLIGLNEKLRVSEQVKGRFIANMRNEINNPLSAILGLAEQVRHPGLPLDRFRQVAGTIKAEATQLDFQLRNIFMAADLEAGEACPSIAMVDIGSLVRDVMDSLACLAEAKPVTLAYEGPEDPFVFPSDGEKLGLVILNLVANAIEFSHPGGRVEVRAEIRTEVRAGLHGEARGEALVISVKDTGVGIRAEDRAAIFEQFRQLDSGATRQHRGQGLGLAVVKTLVELLDGWIRVESHPGQGSCFQFSVPKGEIQADSGDSAFGGSLFFFGDGEEK